MEEVHGVDVSWLHKPTKDAHRRTPSSNGAPARQQGNPQRSGPESTSLPTTPATITPSKPVAAANGPANTPPPSGASTAKSPPKRPGLVKATSGDDAAGRSRRQSWMNSISSKFSSSPGAPDRGPATTQSSNATASAYNSAAAPTDAAEVAEQSGPYIPSKPKDASFLSSLTRRLSSASQSAAPLKPQRNGGVCPRRVLNVDPNRERCLLPEMDQARLRRVSFCVDVEIAGGPRYRDDDDDDEAARKRKQVDFKMKERAEGQALKHPEALKEEKDTEGAPKLEQKTSAVAVPGRNGEGDVDEEDLDASKSPPKGADSEAAQRKRDKKKQSEAERKERKEKRRRRAEENGQIPVELSLDGQDEDTSGNASPVAPSPLQKGPNSIPLAGDVPLPPAKIRPPQPQANAARNGRPTTDPVRIYRRCCQLRETPILKRITEQLMSPTCCLPQEPGVVGCLDLTGSRLQSADVATLGDWLAVVPVKKLILEDADINDEGVRCVLAGLLAAKRPEPTKRTSAVPLHRQGASRRAYEERSGVIEKLTLKNNSRISRQGWKYIAMFIYMCRSIKAIDLSMNHFPDTLPPSAHSTPVKNPSAAPPGKGADVDATETFYKCLAERPGGSRLEELILSECGFSAPQLRKIIDGVIVSGTARLGLAGNHLDDEGLQYVMMYLSSGVCHGLDLGGNDLRGKLTSISEALDKKPEAPCWGLSLADCNLDSASLKPLMPALQQLPNFRFVDLSHNRDLFADNGTVSLLRRYIGQMKWLKRMHLSDCGISPKQAIALADALADGPRLAHLNLLHNPQLTALANATTEAQQEEACALYASLMAAVRVSSTLICIDIDVPSQDNSEVVKALAKQVVAYSLRNMEQFAIAEATGMAIPTANAATALASPYGGEKGVKETAVPDVLMHLVGHVDGVSQNHDNDDPAPDDDYIVGGTGVVKALQYVLGEKANDRRSSHSPATSRSGADTPTNHRPDSSAGLIEEQRGKAKKMSTDLLDSARKIRSRLQPALANEAAAGDEMAYRRLIFLDQTLENMIQRFEEEYPETRPAPRPGSPRTSVSNAPAVDTTSANQSSPLASVTAEPGAAPGAESDEEVDAADEYLVHRAPLSRKSSDVGLASRAQTIEEGRLHRMGQQLRRDVVDSPRNSLADPSTDPSSPITPLTTADSRASPSPTPASNPATSASPSALQSTTSAAGDAAAEAAERERLRGLGAHFEGMSGPELKLLYETTGIQAALAQRGSTFDDLRRLQQEDPEAWAQFVEAQTKARLNVAGASGAADGRAPAASAAGDESALDAPASVVGE